MVVNYVTSCNANVAKQQTCTLWLSPRCFEPAHVTTKAPKKRNERPLWLLRLGAYVGQCVLLDNVERSAVCPRVVRLNVTIYPPSLRVRKPPALVRCVGFQDMSLVEAWVRSGTTWRYNVVSPRK